MVTTITWIIAFVAIVGVGMLAGKSMSSSKQWSGGDKTMGMVSIGCVLGAWQIGGMSIVCFAHIRPANMAQPAPTVLMQPVPD